MCSSFANLTVAADARQAATNAVVLAPCELPDVQQRVRCGLLDVPENPSQPGGRRLQIGVAVISATEQAQPDPLVPLMGGPGEETIRDAAYFIGQFAPLRRDHDILLVDQRGTGRSATLRCDLHSPADPAASLHHLFPPAAVKRCLRQLSGRADLTQYTYTHFANDLEQIRRVLGYGKLNLFSGSYGTRAAQVFIRTYPQSVRTVYFGSMVPVDIPTPLVMAQASQTALDEVFRACAADAACDVAFPNLREELREVLARLASGNVRVSIPGRTGTFPIHRGRVVEWLRSMLYRPVTAAALPWIIHRAYVGDLSPLVEGILTGAQAADRNLSFGLFFSITCNDDVAFLSEEDIVRETQGTLMGDYRVRQQQAACREWPKVTYPADYRTPLRSSVPALFVAGDLDAASPQWMTRHAMPGFTNSAEVILVGKGHTDVTDCITGVYEQFVRTGTARGLDTSACTPTSRPPFRTDPMQPIGLQ